MSSSNGGAPVAGGSPGVACTDTPPNNGDTCAHAVEYNWCAESWLADSCQASCKKCTASSGAGGTSSGSAGSPGSGGSLSGGPTLPPVTGGKDGWASRYWDCCKPACGWSSTTCGKNGTSSDGGDSACSGGSAFMCYDFTPWAVSDTLSYGFVAAAGSNYSCGKCFQFTFNGGGAANSASLNGKSMVVQVLNTGGDVAESQFDLLVPGGGVGQFNACSNQWSTSTADLGAQYGGFATTCGNDKTCIKNKCTTVFAGKPDLQAGCDWYLNWFGGADNPKFSYKEIACPAAITAKSGH
jgi:Glycosyl hydrolase family 45